MMFRRRRLENFRSAVVRQWTKIISAWLIAMWLYVSIRLGFEGSWSLAAFTASGIILFVILGVRVLRKFERQKEEIEDYKVRCDELFHAANKVWQPDEAARKQLAARVNYLEQNLESCKAALQALHAHVQNRDFMTASQFFEALEYLLANLPWPGNPKMDYRPGWGRNFRTLIVRRRALHRDCTQFVKVDFYGYEPNCPSCNQPFAAMCLAHQKRVCETCRIEMPTATVAT